MPRRSPEVIVERREALSLAAKMRYIGSVNLDRLRRERGTRARGMRLHDEAGSAAIESLGLLVTTLEEGMRGAERPGKIPHFVRFDPITGALSYTRLGAVHHPPVVVGTSAPRFLVDTDDGKVFVFPTTLVVWLDA